MAKDFKFIVEDMALAKEFYSIFGRCWVCITSPLPVPKKLAGVDVPQMVVWLDMDEITPNEFYRLVMHMAAKYDKKPMWMSQYLTLTGLPLAMLDGHVVVDNPTRWLTHDEE